jgi:two-component system C4-dicarboxylate transport sensor histidine kinase DctB
MTHEIDNPYPPRSWLQNNIKFLYIITLMIVLPLWVLASFHVFTNQAQKNLHQVIHNDLLLFADSLESELEKYRSIPKMLMMDVALANSVSNQQLFNSTHIHTYLQHIRTTTNSDEVFLLGTAGQTLVSTNIDNEGLNYAHTPFFQDAMQGNSGGFFTMGVNAGIRGYYFSESLSDRSSGEVIGVIVVKVNMARLERGWLHRFTPMMITDDNQIVIAASTASWLFTSRQRLTDAQKQRIRLTRKYPTTSFPILPIEVIRNIEGADIVKLPKLGYERVLETSYFLPDLAWTLYAHGDLKQLDLTIQRNTGISVLLCILVLSLTYVAIQRRLQLNETLARREVNQHRLQQAKDLLETRVAERTKALQASNQELTQTQQELIHSAKLATLGQLATSVTHEINQPLTAIMALTENAEQWLARAQPDKAQEKLIQIKNLAHKMGLITSHLKTFGRKTDDKNEWICPQEALDNALSLLQSRIKEEGVETRIVDMSSIQVMANGVRLEQVFINLLTNALDAMKKSPCKRISIYFRNSTLEDVQQTTIFFTDNGSGIDSEHLHHLFDPFFSTKDIGVGLGLGLTISYSIIKTMGGELSAKNSADGAEFAIQLQAKKRH